jgi:putative MATE family efflux protein
MGHIYLTWTALVLPFNALLFVGNGALRGAGDTRTPMLVMGAVNVINVVIALVLIQGLGPVPALGVAGAGIAAAVATVAGTLMVIGVLMHGRAGLELRQFISRPDRRVLKQLLDIGLPAAGENLLMRVSFLTYTRAISSLGTVAYAAYLIAQRVESLNTMPAMGFSVAAMTLAGQSLGAGQPDRARRAVFRSVEIAFVVSMVWACFSFFFPRTMLSLFTNDPEVIAQGILPVRMVAFAQPVMSVAFSLSGGLRGIGDTRAVMWITGVGSWMVRIPVAILSVTWLGLGLPGVQLSMVLDWTIRMILSGWRFRPSAWGRLSAKRLAQVQAAPAGE